MYVDEDVREKIESFREKLESEKNREVTLKEASKELFNRLEKDNRKMRDLMSDLDLFELG